MTSHGKSEMGRPIPPGYRSYSRPEPAINFSEHSILRNLPEASISSILPVFAVLWDGDMPRIVSEICRRSRQCLSIQIMLTG